MPRKKLQLLLERFSLTCKKNRGLFRVNKSIEIDENLLANLIAKCCQIPITIPEKSNSQIDREISQALQTARANSQSFALGEIEGWVEELMTRVDQGFLPWYFNYFNQKQFEGKAFLSGLYSSIAHWVNTDNPPPEQVVAENLTKTIQTEFTKRVIRPQEAQLRLERITRDTVNLYVSNLSNELENIQASYQIPQGKWDRYLSDIAITIQDTEGNISNTSIKLLVGGATALGVKSLIPVVKVGSTVYDQKWLVKLNGSFAPNSVPDRPFELCAKILTKSAVHAVISPSSP